MVTSEKRPSWNLEPTHCSHPNGIPGPVVTYKLLSSVHCLLRFWNQFPSTPPKQWDSFHTAKLGLLSFPRRCTHFIPGRAVASSNSAENDLSWLSRGVAAIIPFPVWGWCVANIVSISERKNQRYICVVMFLVSVFCQTSLLLGTVSQTHVLQFQWFPATLELGLEGFVSCCQHVSKLLYVTQSLNGIITGMSYSAVTSANSLCMRKFPMGLP